MDTIVVSLVDTLVDATVLLLAVRMACKAYVSKSSSSDRPRDGYSAAPVAAAAPVQSAPKVVIRKDVSADPTLDLTTTAAIRKPPRPSGGFGTKGV